MLQYSQMLKYGMLNTHQKSSNIASDSQTKSKNDIGKNN